MLVSLIVQNGGLSIIVGEHGVLPDALPQLARGALTQLRRNGFLTVQQEGAGLLVGPGPRIREIAAHWQIALPEPADERGRRGCAHSSRSRPSASAVRSATQSASFLRIGREAMARQGMTRTPEAVRARSSRTAHRCWAEAREAGERSTIT